jgi:tight adherence protein C
MVLLVILSVLLLGAGVALLFHGFGFVKSGGTAETIGQIESYGFAAQPTSGPGSSPAQRGLVGFAGQLGKLVQTIVGVGEHGIRRDLLSAGMYDTDPLTIVGYRVMASAAGAVFWIWLAATKGFSFLPLVVGTIVVGLIGWMAPITVIRRNGRRRTARIDYDLPELIDILVVTLEAGLSFLSSLHMAADRLEGPLGTELRLTLQEQRMGLTTNDALDGMLRRCETPSLRTFVRSVLQGESLGVSTGQIMRNLAIEMRKRRRAAAEERAQKAPVKMLFPLVFLIFPAMFVILLGPAAYSISKIFDSTG